MGGGEHFYHRLTGHVASPLDHPFVVLIEQDGADEPRNRGFVWEDADDIGSALDLAVETRAAKIRIKSREQAKTKAQEEIDEII